MFTAIDCSRPRVVRQPRRLWLSGLLKSTPVCIDLQEYEHARIFLCLIRNFLLREIRVEARFDVVATRPDLSMRGLLQRQPVRKLSEAIVGKEGDVLARDHDNVDQAFETSDIELYGANGDPWQDLVLPCVRLFPVADVAARCHVDARTVKRWRTGDVRPDREEVVARQLARMAADWLSDLDWVRSNAERDVYTTLRQFVERHHALHQSLSRSVSEHATHTGIRGFAEHLSIPFETVRSWVRVGIPMNPARLRSIHQLVAECRLIGAGDERR